MSSENRKLVQTVSTSAMTFAQDLLETHDARLSSRGGHFTREQLIPVYFAAILGVPDSSDEAEYRNTLFTFREELIKSDKFLMYFENSRKKPTDEELAYFYAVNKDDTSEMRDDFAALINIQGDKVRTELAKKVYLYVTDKMTSGTADKLYEYSTMILTWMFRCVNSDYYRNNLNEIPVILYYGCIDERELEFLHFMSQIGIDVIYISSDKSVFNMLRINNFEGRMQVFDFAVSKDFFPYPDKIVKTKFATMAYSAKREIDSVFYDDTAMFKDFQYSKMHTRTLKTTYEEVNILWHQQAKFRTGFEVTNDTVMIPNLFVKISGVKDGNLPVFWDDVKYKLSPDCMVVNKGISYDKTSGASLKVYDQFIADGKVDIYKLKSSQYNRYRFLSDSLQTLIFEKMNEAAESGFLKLDESEMLHLIIHVGLNIDKNALKILQGYDFTKDIPKFVVTDVVEDTFNKVECVQLVLFNLLGFDIIIYTPTGYKDIETYVNETAFETFMMNEFSYNKNVPKFKLPDKVPDYLPNVNSGGLFKNIFKKGKK